MISLGSASEMSQLWKNVTFYEHLADIPSLIRLLPRNYFCYRFDETICFENLPNTSFFVVTINGLCLVGINKIWFSTRRHPFDYKLWRGCYCPLGGASDMRQLWLFTPTERTTNHWPDSLLHGYLCYRKGLLSNFEN